MKISDKGPTVNLDAYLKNVSDKGSDPSVAKGGQLGAPSGEKIDLSEKAKDIRSAKKAMENVPDIRTEKVESLKEAISKGVYNVKGEVIADKMIRQSILDFIL